MPSSGSLSLKPLIVVQSVVDMKCDKKASEEKRERSSNHPLFFNPSYSWRHPELNVDILFLFNFIKSQKPEPRFPAGESNEAEKSMNTSDGHLFLPSLHFLFFICPKGVQTSCGDWLCSSCQRTPAQSVSVPPDWCQNF